MKTTKIKTQKNPQEIYTQNSKNKKTDKLNTKRNRGGAGDGKWRQ